MPSVFLRIGGLSGAEYTISTSKKKRRAKVGSSSIPQQPDAISWGSFNEKNNWAKQGCVLKEKASDHFGLTRIHVMFPAANVATTARAAQPGNQSIIPTV